MDPHTHTHTHTYIHARTHNKLRRVNYSDVIIYLKENDIRKDDGTFYEFGEVNSCTGIFPSIKSHTTIPHSSNNMLSFVCYLLLQDIPEAPERKMTDKINEVCEPAVIRHVLTPPTCLLTTPLSSPSLLCSADFQLR